MRDLLDAAWGDFPTEDVGYDWGRYTGAARPSAEWVVAVIAHSRLTFIQESYSSRSSEGYDVGVADCRYAEARAREVYPGYRGSVIVAVSDFNAADRWDASEYGRGWSAAATFAFLPYGTPAICASFCAGAGSNPLNLMGDMVPETWGVTSPPMVRLITQTVGVSPVPNTDLDIVHADYTGAPVPVPAPLLPEESEMYVVHGPQATMAGNRRAIMFGPAGKPLQSWYGPSALGYVQVARDEAPIGVPHYVVRTDDPADPAFAALVELADHPQVPAVGGVVDEDAIATKVADKLAQRLAA